MSGEPLRRELEQLVRDWDRVAMPRQGRYISSAGSPDERGVVSVPSPVRDPQLMTLADIPRACFVHKPDAPANDAPFCSGLCAGKMEKLLLTIKTRCL